MRRLLVICALLLVFSPLTATADTFSLWENFPQDNPINDPMGLSVGAWNPSSPTPYTPLVKIGNYSFAKNLSGSTPIIRRADEPWIKMIPGASEYAVLSGHPDKPESINIHGYFQALIDSTVTVSIGRVSNIQTNPVIMEILGSRTLFGTDLLWEFNFTGIDLSPENSLFFAVNSGGNSADDIVFLKSTIETPVPVPGTLLLLGSGLLGLAGLGRRLRRS